MRIRNSVIQTPGALEILTCIYFYENVCCVYFESCHFVIFVDCIDISKVLFLCSRNKSSKLSNIFHPFLGYFIHIRTESVVFQLHICTFPHNTMIFCELANKVTISYNCYSLFIEIVILFYPISFNTKRPDIRW